MKVKAKSVRTGRIMEKTFRADEKVTQAIVEKTAKQFLYSDGNSFVFMDTEDYSQMEVPNERIGDKKNYLVEGEDVSLVIYDNEILDIELPPQIKMKVVEAEPGIKGNTATGATKKITLETGLTLEVPLFINEGENIIVDTRTGAYVSRT
jgi:elongation factor P